MHSYFTGCKLQGLHLPLGLLSCSHSGAQNLRHSLSGDYLTIQCLAQELNPSQPVQRIGGKGEHPFSRDFIRKGTESPAQMLHGGSVARAEQQQ